MSQDTYDPMIFMEAVKIESEGGGLVRVTYRADGSADELVRIVSRERAASTRIGDIIGIDYRTSAYGPQSQREQDLEGRLKIQTDLYNKIGGDARLWEMFPRKTAVFGMASLEPMGSEA